MALVMPKNGTTAVAQITPDVFFLLIRRGVMAGKFLPKTIPVSPYPLNLRGAISPPSFWGWSVRNPFFTVFSGGRPLNTVGAIVTPLV